MQHGYGYVYQYWTDTDKRIRHDMKQYQLMEQYQLMGGFYIKNWIYAEYYLSCLGESHC